MATAIQSGVVLNGAAIRQAVSAVLPLCRPNSPKPILGCLRLAVADGTATVAATDLENAVQIRFPCEGELETVVPADVLNRICGFASDDDELCLNTKGSMAEFCCGRSRWKIPTNNPAEYPEIKIDIGSEAAILSAAWLRSAIHGTAHAADGSTSARYTLGGLLFEFIDNAISVVATDGRCLCVARGTQRGRTLTQSGIVPLSACKIILRCLPDEGEVELRLTNNDLRIACEGVSISARLLEGRYPRWRDTLGSRNLSKVSIPSDQLRNALERVRIVTNEVSRGVDFSYSDGRLSFAAKTEAGETGSEIPITGPMGSTCLDPDFVLNFLRDAAGEEVLVGLQENGPCLFESNGFEFIVMSLRK